MVHNIKDAVKHQPLQDLLRGLVTLNMADKGVWSAQNSLLCPSVSLATQYAVNGVIVTNAASSSAFPISDTPTVPVGGGMVAVCCFNAAGSGIAYPGTVLTSAQVSTAGGGCANILAFAQGSNATGSSLMPSIPDTMCPVALYTVAVGTVAHVAGSHAFSQAVAAGGSVAFTNIMTVKKTG
jgi:hypothetical protein